MKHLKVGLVLALVLAAFPLQALAKDCLWLFPDSSKQLALTDLYYVDLDYNNREDPLEPMLTESYVVIDQAYTLDIYNHDKAPVSNVVLVISVNNISLLRSVTIGGTTIQASSFVNGSPALGCDKKAMPSHGVFPTYYAEYVVGDIGARALVTLQISVDGDVGLKTHYDAYGHQIAGKKRRCVEVHNPFSHDFTGIYYGHKVEFNKGDVIVQDWEGMPPSTYPDGTTTPYNPIIDAAFSFPQEWLYASVRTNLTNSGSIYKQNQVNWVATSVQTSSQVMYPDVTLFELHNFWAATTQELADYNIFSYPYLGHTVTAWVFMAGDEPDDSFWLPRSQGLELSHLISEGTGNNKIIDQGFIVRLDNNPMTDRHWFPGMPEPGDLGWNWLQWYGFFGRAGYNDSGWKLGMHCTSPGLHEVYEVAIHPPFDDGNGIPPPVKRCWTIEWVPIIADPHNGVVTSYAPVIVFLGPGHVDKPFNPWPRNHIPWPEPDPYEVPNVPVWIEVVGEPIAVEGQTLTLEVYGGSVPPEGYAEEFPVKLLATFDPHENAKFQDLGGGKGLFTYTPEIGRAGGVFEVKFKAINPFFQNGLLAGIPVMPAGWRP
jgi:hypothetical protein